MDKTLIKRIAMAAGVILLLSWLIINITNVEQALPGLDELHMEEMKIETEISERKVRQKALQFELGEVAKRLEELRQRRIDIVEERNSIINQEQPPVGAALASAKIVEEKLSSQPIIKEESDQVKLCYKHTAAEDQNQYVRIASEISNNDIDFLALLDGENGLWTIDRKSCNTDGSCDYGFCQINKYWHPEIVNDERFFTDPRWQLEQCYRLYTGGTKFYADVKIPQMKKHFTCPIDL